MAVFANIAKILDTRLKALPSSPSIAWPNTKFVPGNFAMYIRPTLILGDTDVYTLNDRNMLPGIYQVDVFSQLNRGIASAYAVADEIKNHFDGDKEMTEGSTILHIHGISLAQGERDDAWFHIYVSINFQAFGN